MELSGYRTPSGTTPAGMVAFLGDSRTQGTGYTYPQQCMALASVVSKRYRSWNFGVSGYTMQDVASTAAANLDSVYMPGLVNIAAIWAGVNDGVAGASAATIYSRTATVCGIARGLGWSVVLCNEIDGQSTALNTAGWHGTIWPALNALIAAGWSGIADRLVDLGAVLTNALDQTIYKNDFVHQTDWGQGRVAAAVAAQVATL